MSAVNRTRAQSRYRRMGYTHETVMWGRGALERVACPARSQTIDPQRTQTMSKGTPHRGIRIDDALWREFQAATQQAGSNPSQVIRGLVREWVDKNTQHEGAK